MGCDIHMVLEQHDDEFGWVGVDSFRCYRDHKGEFSYSGATDRNYRRFAALAGVRGDGPEPKGIPDDASPLTRIAVRGWGGDGHSHSWLSVKEAAAIFVQRLYPGQTPLDPADYEALYPADFWFGVDESELEKSRLIFWFDN